MYTKEQLKNLDKIPDIKEISLKLIQEFYCEYLTNRRYIYRLRQHKSKEEFKINIIFFKENLPHLLAIQKIVPHPNTFLYRGECGYNGILNESITIKRLEDIDSQRSKSERMLPSIESRFTCFYLIPKLMEDCKMVKFSKKTVKGNCTINSNFMLYNEKLGVKLHLGVIREQANESLYVPETFIVKSIRARDSQRLTEGQTYMNVIDLKIEPIL